MDVVVVLFTAAIILALSFLGDLLSRKVMLPSVILLIILGLICGPLFGPLFGLDRSSLVDVLPLLASLTLIFVAFDAGAHMNVREVMVQSYRALVLSILGFILSTITIGIFLHFAFSLRWAYSFLLSSAWGGVNTATVVAVSRHLSISGKTLTTLTISSLIDDIVVLVTALTILGYMTVGATGFYDISLTLIRNICVSVFVGVIVGIAWLNILHLSRRGEFTFTFTLAAVFLLYSGTEMLGGTGAIAVFLFGLILGNSESLCKSLKMRVDIDQLSRLKKSIVKFHSELTFILVSFFFTFIGLIYVFTGIFDLVIGLIISFLLHGVRFISVSLGTWRSELSADLPAVGFIVGKGATSAAVSILPLAYGLPNTTMLTSIALNVILFTNILSMLLPFLASHVSSQKKGTMRAGSPFRGV
ncbi:MAG: cation:proton antiporter [Candidatus Bathyarchaeota archaeon]|nr:cation:proton antiporter [Candidatus Bathyarchaeota archaeon]